MLNWARTFGVTIPAAALKIVSERAEMGDTETPFGVGQPAPRAAVGYAERRDHLQGIPSTAPDNETSTRMALANLPAPVERR